jgi:NAD(P)-dependent dehydrogenase (short-subunit alcohol dehydrogenase family)
MRPFRRRSARVTGLKPADCLRQLRLIGLRTVARFGSLDIVVNNASAISLTPVTQTDIKHFDLMQFSGMLSVWLT